MKIIEFPDHLIQELEAALGAHNSDVISSIFSRHISDAVIAVTAEDIAAQAIEWANFQWPEHEAIDKYFDFKRYSFVQDTLLKELLDIEAIANQIQDDWDMNSSTSAEAIYEALFAIYKESAILNKISTAAAQYEANNG
jgi:hypothetical protein